LVGQAVAELHLGRLEEAEVALQQALEKNPTHVEALANSIVLSVLEGKEFADHLRYAHMFLPKAGMRNSNPIGWAE
jgi:coatomer protein complex subunit epsilon